MHVLASSNEYHATMEKLRTGESTSVQTSSVSPGRDPTRGSHGAEAFHSQDEKSMGDIIGASAECSYNTETSNGKGHDALRVVIELANWIDQSGETAAVMPVVELLQNLSHQQ
jgi:hypothetical protein